MHSINTLAPQTVAKIEPGDFLTTKQAASLLNIEPRTLENWRWSGTGPRHHKVGMRAVRYLRAELLAFVAGDGELVSSPVSTDNGKLPDDQPVSDKQANTKVNAKSAIAARNREILVALRRRAQLADSKP